MSTMQITKNDHIQGSSSAPVILVEYGDYECSYCGRAYPIVKQLQRTFGKKLTFVFRNYPLTEIHRHALDAALAAEAADRQGKFWEMHDILYENQTHLHPEHLLAYAKQIGLDLGQFKQDFKSEAVIDKIQSDINSANRIGIQGTPSFFVNGQFFEGNWMTSDLEDAIRILL